MIIIIIIIIVGLFYRRFDNREVYFDIFLEHQVSAKSMAMLEFGNFTVLLHNNSPSSIVSKQDSLRYFRNQKISIFRYTSQY
jgi:hypothetical protein